MNSLIQKGYIKKVQSETDKREFHLEVTDKYYKYFNLSQNYIDEIIHRVENRFSKEELEVFDRVLDVTLNELMPEVDIPSTKLSK